MASRASFRRSSSSVRGRAIVSEMQMLCYERSECDRDQERHEHIDGCAALCGVSLVFVLLPV